MVITSAICSQCMAKNSATMVLLFHFSLCLFHTNFESFLENIFDYFEKTIFPLYNMHSIVFIASEILVSCGLLYDSVLKIFRKVQSESPKFYIFSHDYR